MLNIKSTARPADEKLNRDVKVAAQTLKPPAKDETAFAMVVSQTGSDGTSRSIFAPMSQTTGTEQSFSEFLKTPGMVAAREFWSLFKPAFPDNIKLAGNTVFLVLDGAGLYGDWSRVTPFTSGQDLAMIGLKSAKLGVDLLSNLNGAAGRPTEALSNVKLAIADTQTILRGADPLWLGVHGTWSNESPLYKVVDSGLKVAEAALADDPKWGGVKLNGIRDMASADPKLFDRLTQSNLSPDLLQTLKS